MSDDYKIKCCQCFAQGRVQHGYLNELQYSDCIIPILGQWLQHKIVRFLRKHQCVILDAFFHNDVHSIQGSVVTRSRGLQIKR